MLSALRAGHTVVLRLSKKRQKAVVVNVNLKEMGGTTLYHLTFKNPVSIYRNKTSKALTGYFYGDGTYHSSRGVKQVAEFHYCAYVESFYKGDPTIRLACKAVIKSVGNLFKAIFK